MADDARVKFESALFKALAAARMTAVEYRHVVFLGNGVDGIEQRQEVFLGVDVFLAVGRQEDVSALVETETGVDVARLDVGEILVKHLGHGRTGDIGTLFRQSAVGEVTARMLAVAEVDVADDVDDAPVGLFGQALVLAAVAGLHVEDGDVEAFGGDGRETRVGVAEDEQCVGPYVGHQLVRAVDDVAYGSSEIVTDGIHIYLGIGELQVFEEDAVEVVVVVLACVGENDVEILAALIDSSRQTDNLRSSAYDYQQFEFAIVGKMDVFIIGFHLLCYFRQEYRRNRSFIVSAVLLSYLITGSK